MISDRDIKKLKELSRIDLGSKEEARIKKDLEAILGYFEKLKEVSVDGIEEMSFASEISVSAREDEETLSPPEIASQLVEAAPEKEEGYIKVKAVLQKE
ncbi:MAG: Asp-tRNA(Asn)/Glu-tRNA(Gln) amidotransferase GatCAB subunit C [Candidatus Niyogibacteria bacterium CG10_big_fil_rev_8_21_14_0_10_42_19]|uniref:Aspartyl/glutamyl-tRNA(Asn/Gln) amidotransferase subunit C n=1 Tax=Candidatus Niyogibacteria bacterium CG10_big_fil_rev_8_21_14_0_10_42_19 TaxID=1974725 RepID=A0A2H0TET2_9BACT|nr:MAG: Asp-tRNA(Asn)/Glu-tRNA(Gln) amidotransferase GatCAB subunit C [Candidatus Niyogibacteria bacterium CG10_big_fil_rev_8_21_14_0_10_42_19]